MNRQVPSKKYYLLIGRGRLARHFSHYFDLKNISYLQWSRVDSFEDLQRFLLVSEKIFLAISDDAIEKFILEYNLPTNKTIHFSGALSTPLAMQLHPLMTFAQELYDLQTYQSMCFVSSANTPSIERILPELSNVQYFIPEGKEAFYHALCVLSGNGTTLLWQSVLEQFEKTLSIPPQALWPYLEQIVFNLQKNPQMALTGPWVRNDQKTIQTNELALQNSALSSLYHSFQGVYHEDRT